MTCGMEGGTKNVSEIWKGNDYEINPTQQDNRKTYKIFIVTTSIICLNIKKFLELLTQIKK